MVLMMKYEKVEVLENGAGGTGGTRTLCSLSYGSLKTLDWDHSASSVKLTTTSGAYVAVRVVNSLELESEAKLRLRGLAQSGGGSLNLQFNYLGVFAGPTKPKPFQRKRANLSKYEQGKLPPLGTMRDLALKRHTGSGAPSKQSKRMRIALTEIHRGVASFNVVSTQQRGQRAPAGMLSVESRLNFSSEYADVPGVSYFEGSRQILGKRWDDVKSFSVSDKAHQGENANGIEFEFNDGRVFYFVVLDVMNVQNAVHHFWNRNALKKGREVKPASIHGRDVVKMTTLEGEIDAPPRPKGDADVVDESGNVVRTSQASRASSSARRKTTLVGAIKGKKATDIRLNPRVDKYWDAVVLHQGWLLKKGGVAKSWIKRYAVLYSTSMGHFLCYYADFAKSPLFHSEERERNVIDLSKTTFVRPRSNNKEAPTNSFDICTIEREWTLSAENKVSMQKWLQVITRAIDEDVAIVPDDELVFIVKPRVDPSMKLEKNEYKTALKVSASGVAVCHVAGADDYREKFFWCYTDFFKWSILHHQGKAGLQVSVFTTQEFDVKDRHEFLFRTKDAVKLATAIEFYIEKFMAAMHLYLEGSDNLEPPNGARQVSTASSGHFNMATTEMGQDAFITDDLLGHSEVEDDFDDVRGADTNGGYDPNNVGSILDLFTVEPGPTSQGNGSDPFGSSDLHAVDDPFAPKPLDPVFVKQPEASEPDFIMPAAPVPVAAPEPVVQAPPPPPPPPPPQPVAQAVSVDATGSMLAESPLYDALARLNEKSGTLYENDAISIQIEQEYRGSQGRLLLTLKNEYETPTSIDDIAIDLDVGGSGIRYQVGPLSSTSLPSPGDSAWAQIMLECMQPYDEAPSAVLTFAIAGQRYELKVAIPSLFTKFMEAVDLAPQVFVQRWATLGAPGLEKMITFGANAGPANAGFARPQLESLVNIAFASGVDDNNGTILSGAAALRTGTENAGGEKISVGCLIRLEMNEAAKAYRLTVRTAVPRVSESLARAIQQVL